MTLFEAMTVDLPEGELDGLRIERFTIGDRNIHNLMLGVRGTRAGTYTKLAINGRLWMSDTDAEKHDHLPALRAASRLNARRVLVNGLGLGMVVKALLTMDHVEHVDIVEVDERVVRLVGGHYAADPRVHVHHADAYEQAKRWPAGSRWEVVWSDIWPDLCTDYLPAMTRLRRSYGRRSDWHGCWGRDLLLRQYAREQRESRSREHFRAAWALAGTGKMED
jgi:hypothetical protein